MMHGLSEGLQVMLSRYDSAPPSICLGPQRQPTPLGPRTGPDVRGDFRSMNVWFVVDPVDPSIIWP